MVKWWKLILVGVAAGLLGGTFGVGGGVILVPLLVAIGFERHRAHATSLAAFVLTASAGALSFALAGEIDVTLGILLGIGGVVGSVIGASLMHRISARALTIVFGVILLAAGVRMIVSSEPLPGSADLSAPLHALIGGGIGLIAGFLAGIAGIGGGVIIVPASVLLLGVGQHEAQGTSLLAIVFTAVAGSIVNFRNRRVRPRDGLFVGLGGVIGSVSGARLALGIDGRSLSVAFGVLVLVIAIRSLYQAFRSSPVSSEALS